MGFFVLPDESTHSTVLMNSARNSCPIKIYIDYVYLHSHDEVKELHVTDEYAQMRHYQMDDIYNRPHGYIRLYSG